MNLFPGRLAADRGVLLARVATGASLALTVPADVTEGTAVLVAVRPERAAIARERPSDGSLTAHGRIEQILYLGATREIRVRFEDGAGATVETPNRGGDAGFAPGDPVWFVAPPEACLVLIDKR
jgi:ABC-type Fe3+/spermidine/putrescine transport system ATPase subunit